MKLKKTSPPKGAEAASINNKEFANFVDASAVLEIDNKFLMCFAWNSDFWIVGGIMPLNELKEEVAPFYEFVEI